MPSSREPAAYRVLLRLRDAAFRQRKAERWCDPEEPRYRARSHSRADKHIVPGVEKRWLLPYTVYEIDGDVVSKSISNRFTVGFRGCRVCCSIEPLAQHEAIEPVEHG